MKKSARPQISEQLLTTYVSLSTSQLVALRALGKEKLIRMSATVRRGEVGGPRMTSLMTELSKKRLAKVRQHGPGQFAFITGAGCKLLAIEEKLFGKAKRRFDRAKVTVKSSVTPKKPGRKPAKKPALSWGSALAGRLALSGKKPARVAPNKVSS